MTITSQYLDAHHAFGVNIFCFHLAPRLSQKPWRKEAQSYHISPITQRHQHSLVKLSAADQVYANITTMPRPSEVKLVSAERGSIDAPRTGCRLTAHDDMSLQDAAFHGRYEHQSIYTKHRSD